MYIDELDYLKKEAADYENSLTEEEQDEVDEEAMQANVQAWDGAKLESAESYLHKKLDIYTEEVARLRNQAREALKRLEEARPEEVKRLLESIVTKSKNCYW